MLIKQNEAKWVWLTVGLKTFINTNTLFFWGGEGGREGGGDYVDKPVERTVRTHKENWAEHFFKDKKKAEIWKKYLRIRF